MFGLQLKEKFNSKHFKNIIMKNKIIKQLTVTFTCIAIISSCSKSDSPSSPFAGNTYQTEDAMGRPAVNTVFVTATDKDNFNVTIPSVMSAAFQSKFQTQLLALNPGYTTNALGQNAATLTGLLSVDVLNVSTTGTTTFFDGTNLLTGRALADDVIDTELLLIFGGPAGTSNPGLTSDKVAANDKTFLTAFPYLATPW
jgi:hypothetical protein